MAARPSIPVTTSVPGGTAAASAGASAGSPMATTSGRRRAGLGGEQLDRAPRGQADGAEPVGLGRDHVDGLGADRPRRPDEADRHRRSRRDVLPGPRLVESSSVSPSPPASPEVEHPDQIVRRREDEQQAIDPVEHAPVTGQERPHVLQPRSRLMSDSHRSPMGATTATTSPRSAALGTVQGWTCPVMAADATMAKIAPPIRPSQVLLGLTVGAS